MPPSEGHGGRGDWGGGYGGGGRSPSDERGASYRGVGGGYYGGRGDWGGGSYRSVGGSSYGGGRSPYGERGGAYSCQETAPYGDEERGRYGGGGRGPYGGQGRGPYGSEEGGPYGGQGRGPYGGEEGGPSSRGRGGFGGGGGDHDGPGRGGGYRGCGERYGGGPGGADSGREGGFAKNQERGRSVPSGLRGRSGQEGDCRRFGPIATEFKPFKSMRFIIVGIRPALREQHIDCERKIINMGGTILPSTEYDLATHILTLEDITEGAYTLWKMEGKKVVGSAWVDQHHNPTSTDCKTPTHTDAKRVVISTSKRKRSCVYRSPSSKRNLFHSEGERREVEESKFHNWLQCPLDQSSTFTLKDYVDENKDSVVRKLPTPGSEKTHLSLLTCNELKMYIRKCYRVKVSMNRDNKTLRGDYGAANFIVDRSNSVKLGNLKEDALKTITSDNDLTLDREGFARMIKEEVLLGKSIPDDLFEWLKMLLKGDPEDLLFCHTALLEDQLGGEILMSLYDSLLDLEENDPPSYNDVILELAKYNTWKNTRFLDNTYLRETYEHKDHRGKKTIYQSNVRGLLHLFRNCRRHAAISVRLFGCIVGQHFRQIASDFQRAMYKVKCLQKLNLQYTLS